MFAEAVMCLALNMYWEAKNQSMIGQLAVGQVVMNRVEDSRFPNTVCEVVYQGQHRPSWKDPTKEHPIRHKCQFSWYCDGKSDEIMPTENWYKSQIVALQLLDGKYSGVIEGATHYHANWVSPLWRHELTFIGQIGDHLFYRWEN